MTFNYLLFTIIILINISLALTGTIRSNVNIRIKRSWDVAVLPEDIDDTVDFQLTQITTTNDDTSHSTFTILCLVIGGVSTVLLAVFCFCCCYLWKLMNLSRFLTFNDLCMLVWSVVRHPVRSMHELRVAAGATLGGMNSGSDGPELVSTVHTGLNVASVPAESETTV